VTRDRVGHAEELSEDAPEIEHEAQREPWVGQPEPLKRGPREDECLGFLERDDIWTASATRSSSSPGWGVAGSARSRRDPKRA
jgi:hypothetical protein